MKNLEIKNLTVLNNNELRTIDGGCYEPGRGFLYDLGYIVGSIFG